MLILFLIGFIYKDLPDTYFQQDEWAAFGKFIVWQAQPVKEIFKVFFGGLHLTPLSEIFYFLFYRFFGLKYTVYVYTSIFLHCLNSLLVCYLALLLVKDKKVAIIAALFFAVNSFSSQAVTWIAASLSTQSCCFFLLLSLVFLIRHSYSLVLFSFLISLFFKENSIFLFIFLPIFYFLFSQERKKPLGSKPIILFVIFIFFYLGLRIVSAFNVSLTPLETNALYSPPLAAYIVRFITLPFKALAQSFFSINWLLGLSEKLIRLSYPSLIFEDGTVNPFVKELIGLDLVCYFWSLVVMVAIFFAYRYFQKKSFNDYSRGLVFGLSFIFLSSLPLALIRGEAGYASIIEPRHLYIPGIGSSLLQAVLIFAISGWLAEKLGKRTKIKWRHLELTLNLIILVPVMFLHFKNIQKEMGDLFINSQLRKSILEQIKSKYPVLGFKTVFYTESDTAYYGLPDEEKILPFQSGLGQTLLVWYYDKTIPPCLYDNFWLYQIEEQGYKFCQGRGFGYYRKYEDLRQAIKEKRFLSEEVISFRFNSENNSLIDVTSEIREKLKTKT